VALRLALFGGDGPARSTSGLGAPRSSWSTSGSGSKFESRDWSRFILADEAGTRPWMRALDGLCLDVAVLVTSVFVRRAVKEYDATGRDQVSFSSNQRQRTFTKSRNMNCRKIMVLLGCSVRRLRRHWSKTRVYIFAVAPLAALAPSPALVVDSHRRCYRTWAYRDTQFEQRIRRSEKHVKSVVGKATRLKNTSI
jgi:hypothetical protein